MSNDIKGSNVAPDFAAADFFTNAPVFGPRYHVKRSTTNCGGHPSQMKAQTNKNRGEAERDDVEYSRDHGPDELRQP